MEDATLEERDGRWVLRFERRSPQRAEHIWRVLTEPAHLGQWYPADTDLRGGPGTTLRFSFPAEEGPDLEGTVLEHEPPRRLVHTWGDDVVRWELTEDGDETRIVLTAEITDRAAAAPDGAGWHLSLDALERTIAGEVDVPHDRDHTVAVQERYRARFG